jgi:hypothetical protein
MFRFDLDPDSLEASVREYIRANPDRTELAIRELRRMGADRVDVERERAAVLRRQEEQDRMGIAALEASGRFDPQTREFAGTEAEALAIVEAAGAFDGWERDFKALCVLEYIRLARQRRN